MSLKGTFGGRVDPQFRRGTASSERLAVAVAANPVAIGVQAVRIAVAVVNRDSVANVGAVKVRWRRRQAVIRVSRVATLRAQLRTGVAGQGTRGSGRSAGLAHPGPAPFDASGRGSEVVAPSEARGRSPAR